LPRELSDPALELAAGGTELVYTFDARSEDTGIAALLRRLNEQGIDFKDLRTQQSSLEDIFVNLVTARS
jgi:ABC-2 type transport system ATP-binding protein